MALAGRLNLLSAKFTCLVLISIWAYAFWPTILHACAAYIQTGYDYQGLLVLPIVLLLVMHNSSNLKRATPSYYPFGLLLLILFAATWLLATLVELDVLRQLSIISMLISIVLTTCGKKITSILLLPLLCLFLLLPIGKEINFIIMETFSWLLMQVLMLSRQAVYWEANKIFVNNHAYDIHAYLSSLHYSLIFLAIGSCFAILRTRSLMTTFTIATSFIIMPFAILALSLYSYIMLNQWFTTVNLIENNLTIIGWALTIIGLLHAVFLGVFLGDRKDFIARNDNIDWHHNYFAKGQRFLQPVILASCIIFLTPMLSEQLKNKLNYNDVMLPTIPNTIAAWKNPNQEASGKETLTRFRKNQDLIGLSITHNDQLLEPSWKKIKESNKKIKLAQHKLPVHETVFHNEKNKYKIHWSVNYINGHFTTNPTVAKALTHMYSLASHDVKTGIITISTDATSELSFARDRLKNFLQDFAESDAIKDIG